MKSNPIIGLVDHEVDAIDNVSRRYSVFNVVPSNPKNKYLSLITDCVSLSRFR